MRRRCLKCRQLIPAGSYCPAHVPRPASPGRPRGRRLQEARAFLIAARGARCEDCGRDDAPLELHHTDHDHTHLDPRRLKLLCRSCHGKAGIRADQP